jgi:hypothetical protein
MKKVLSVLLFAAFCFVSFNIAPAQSLLENAVHDLKVNAARELSPQTVRGSQIKDIQVFGKKSGVAFTDDALFRTDDNGETWREIALPKNMSEVISAVDWTDENVGWTILGDSQNSRLELLKTADGGNSWTRKAIEIRAEDLAEADLSKLIDFVVNKTEAVIRIRQTSSSNFYREVAYETKDGGETWNFLSRRAEKAAAELETTQKISGENVIDKTSGAAQWFLTSVGNCAAFKTGCVQETKIYFAGKEITPPQIKELAQIEKSSAKLRAENSVFAQMPIGAVRTSLNRGFDKCTAATVAQMQAWWDNSPFYDANIYMSGRNRGCSQPQLTANWVNQVSAMGWGLIPTVVGYQSPCTSITTTAKFSYDPATAEQQGRGEADIAAADANNLGLTPGTVLYYDMERYDETASTPGCRTATKAFLKGWTDRIKQLGYISGVYGSPTNAVNDWIDLPEASRMDAIWMARWDDVASVWIYAAPSPAIPTNVWNNRQRIKQYQRPHDETWGGVTFNIDGNIAEGPVAGIAAAKNKPADFDGDGKSDVSVFRPDSGAWFVLRSSNSSFTGVGFGISSDVLAPGDYDGDGKTDYAVFRPADGAWYIQNRIFRAQQFGAAGDIPVPADYNGDGFTDIAVFRPSNGAWYIWNSSGSPNPLRAEQFGTAGDIPVPGDYDGDGKADIAVFRPSNGTWYLLRSTLGFTGAQFGADGDKPVQADYDGDGKADLGVFRGGVWYLLRSQQGFAGVQFGIAADKPSPGDYDGDGKTDIAVYRDGVWYLLQSTNGFTGIQFGTAGDRTIPSAYVPQN